RKKYIIVFCAFSFYFSPPIYNVLYDNACIYITIGKHQSCIIFASKEYNICVNLASFLHQSCIMGEILSS
ncbi:MAG: hypothetical protein NC548_47705, partial [Lachnospiraceae bacterium]|nr:hypothetical protein [Lachnospiraceae bacterium]